VAAGGRRRALGQHFLRDAGIARAIVDLAAPTARDLVVEIGPGEGALTSELARRAGKVVALEVDPTLAARLRAHVPGVEIVEADAREWDYGTLTAPPDGRVLVVGNLPYSVGKPILGALVAARTAIDRMVLMLQREVAERVAAGPGSRVYGSLSVLTQIYCDAALALRVPPGSFRPPPKVDSAVIRLDVLAAPRVPLEDERRFHVVVRAAFAQRRKTLANALAAGLGRPAAAMKTATEAAGIDSSRRAETLTMLEFAALARQLP
jgi:16S rRNA (adenine1518-N6/adenine1519-N6)-dimethyltransferase